MVWRRAGIIARDWDESDGAPDCAALSALMYLSTLMDILMFCISPIGFKISISAGIWGFSHADMTVPTIPEGELSISQTLSGTLTLICLAADSTASDMEGPNT